MNKIVIPAEAGIASKRLLFKSFVLILFVLLANPLLAQKNKDELKTEMEKADAFMAEQKHSRAIEVLRRLDSLYPGNANINFKAGAAWLSSRTGRQNAIPYLEKAVQNMSEKYREGNYAETSAPVIALFYLGQAYHLGYKFTNAIEVFEKFKPFVGPDNAELLSEIDKYIQWCNNGKNLINAPVTIDIKNIGDAVNSPWPEYAPVISADEATLIFTSRRPDSLHTQLTDDGQHYENIYIAYNDGNGTWTAPADIGENINTEGHEASIGLSVDAQKLFIYKDDKGDGNIYQSILEGDRWSFPQKLSENINSKAWEPSASLSADGNILYFTSDRKGGYGGRDIYRVKKLPNGQWSLPLNLGPVINTPYDEDGPFIHPDGKTLFFSSNSGRSMGGFDVFFSELNEEEQWQPPVNSGYPLNTTDDDIFYSLSADGKRAYYSSFQEGGFGEKDLYVATFVEQKEIPLALIKGEVRAYYGGVPESVEILVTDNETGEMVGVYYPNTKTGKYLFILPPGKNYNVSYEAEGFLFHSDNYDIPDTASYYEISKSIDLEPLVVGSRIVLNNVFFEFGKDVVKSTSFVELEKLKKLFRLNPNVKAEIGGHTDTRGSDEINMKLSEKRAQAVVDELIKLGVDPERLTAKGYGETMPVAKETHPDGTDNPEARALNRRVEMKIMAIE